MESIINPKVKVSSINWFDHEILHEQDSDSKYYDESALDRVVEIEHPQIHLDDEVKTDYETSLAVSRTRILSMDEYITSRAEDEAWVKFAQTHGY